MDNKGKDHYKETLVKYWLEKSDESFSSALQDYEAGRYGVAIRNLYYACFYSLTSVLLKQGKKFKKHSGVRAEFHKSLIKTGKLNSKWGKFYDKVFDSRHESDYQPLKVIQADEVNELLSKTKDLLMR